MKRSKAKTASLIVAGGLTAASGVAAITAARAEEAAPVITPQRLGEIVTEFGIDVSPEGDNALLQASDLASQSAGGVFVTGNESIYVPESQLRHDTHIRQSLQPLAVYVVGTIVNVLNGSYNPARSFDLWAFDGITRGALSDGRAPVRVVGLDSIVGLDISPSAESTWVPDIHASTRYYGTELKDFANVICLARDVPCNDDELRTFVLDQQHANEGTYDPNKIVILRYFSTNLGQIATAPVLSAAPNGGDAIGEIMYICPDNGVCLGANGLPLEHLTHDWQIVDLPGPNELRHILAENCYNASMTPAGTTRGGGVVVRRSMYGHPVTNPISPVVPSTVPPPADAGTVTGDADAGVPPVYDAGPAQPDADAGVPDTGDCGQPDVDGGVPSDVGVPTVSDGGQQDAVQPPVTPEDRYHRLFLGVEGQYLVWNNFMPGPAFMVGPYFGGRLGHSHLYLSGGLNYLYGGQSTIQDPRSRTTLPNPDDPFGLIGIVEASTSTSAHGLVPNLSLSYMPRPWLRLSAGLIVPVIFMDRSTSVSETLQYPNGEIADQEHYSDASRDTVVLGGGRAGIEFIIDPFAIGVGCSAAGNADGEGFASCGLNLGGYFP